MCFTHGWLVKEQLAGKNSSKTLALFRCTFWATVITQDSVNACQGWPINEANLTMTFGKGKAKGICTQPFLGKLGNYQTWNLGRISVLKFQGCNCSWQSTLDIVETAHWAKVLMYTNDIIICLLLQVINLVWVIVGWSWDPIWDLNGDDQTNLSMLSMKKPW